MPIKINYRIIGFVHWDNFKKLYNDLLNYRIKNSLFKEPLWK